jgi:hypothetical protein
MSKFFILHKFRSRSRFRFRVGNGNLRKTPGLRSTKQACGTGVERATARGAVFFDPFEFYFRVVL